MTIFSRIQVNMGNHNSFQYGGFSPQLPPEVNRMIVDEINYGKSPLQRMKTIAALAPVSKSWANYYRYGQYDSKENVAKEIVRAVYKKAKDTHNDLWYTFAKMHSQNPYWSNDDYIVGQVAKELARFEFFKIEVVTYIIEDNNEKLLRVLVKTIPHLSLNAIKEEVWAQPDLYIVLSRWGWLDPMKRKYPLTMDWVRALRSIGIDLLNTKDLQGEFGMSTWDADAIKEDNPKWYETVYIPSMLRSLGNERIYTFYNCSSIERILDDVTSPQLLTPMTGTMIEAMHTYSHLCRALWAWVRVIYKMMEKLVPFDESVVDVLAKYISTYPNFYVLVEDVSNYIGNYPNYIPSLDLDLYDDYDL